MAKKEIKPCSIGCCKECSSECDYYDEMMPTQCYYHKQIENYRGKVVWGSDNGLSGSVVLLDINDGHIVHIEPYPNAKRMYQLIKDFQPLQATIEQVFMAPGFRGVASSNFEIMGRYMQLFELLDVPYDTVRAVSWRAKLGIKAKGRPAQKAASIAKSKELFSEKDFDKLNSNYTRLDKELHKRVTERWPDDNKCESALIAYYTWIIWKEQNDRTGLNR